MESQQDTIDLTINDDDDDSLFPPELGETMGSSELGETVGNKETAKQNLVKQELYAEDDTMSIYGLEDSEITTTDGEEEKEEEENGKKKVIFKRIWSNFGKKPRKATFKSAAFDVYTCTHKTIYPGHRAKFSLGFKMKMPEGYCAKIYMEDWE